MPENNSTIPFDRSPRYTKNNKIYRAWRGMIDRCYNPHCRKYSIYGGAGIIVCERWRHSFDNFQMDMGNPPTPRHTLDRWPNAKGNYEPTNTRWATYTEQNRNRPDYNVLIEFNGGTKTIGEWAELTGIEWSVIRGRLKRGWPIARIFEPPKQLAREITINGITKSLNGWAKASGMTRETIAYRIRRGLSPEQAITLPLVLNRQRYQTNDHKFLAPSNSEMPPQTDESVPSPQRKD